MSQWPIFIIQYKTKEGYGLPMWNSTANTGLIAINNVSIQLILAKVNCILNILNFLFLKFKKVNPDFKKKIHFKRNCSYI